jgi:glycosyltransferase involved in cell wall biosynthesis
MGAIVPPADSDSLAQALIRILDHPNGYHGDREEITKNFAPGTVAAEYETLLESLLARKPVEKLTRDR